MGGLRSGRGPWGRRRREVEECVVVDLYALLRTRAVRPGEAHEAVELLRGGKYTAAQFTSFAETTDQFVIQCHDASGRFRSHTLHCARRPQRLGGVRWFLVCPLSGGLVSKLYLPPGETRFGSRAAYRLAYETERMSELERCVKAFERLEKRIGPHADLEVTRDAIPPRPRGMHQSTYRRLERRWDVLSARLWRRPSRL